MDKIKGLEVLKDVVKNNKQHQDYERVTALADKYFKLFTGKKIEDLLARIVTRETEDEFAQRTEITKSVTPAILNSTKLPFQKATRKQPIVRTIEFKDDSEKRKQELEKYIGMYWGDKSVEEFLEYSFVDYNYTDPNAFLITEFGEFDPRIEKAQPYPFIATSEEAVMFEYHNEILDYLIVKLPIKYMDRGTEQDGVKFTMYLGMDTIEFTQVAEEEFSAIVATDTEGSYIEIEKKFYKVLYYEPKNEKVPAIRFGFIRDAETKGRTFVSVFHCVILILEKTLKINSELDLSTSMVAFPQRYRYVTPCTARDCNHGTLPNGGRCDVCDGTGLQPIHRGVSDLITLDMPRDPAEMIPLESLAYDHSPDIELLRFDSEYLESLEKKCQSKMFNADLFTRAEVSVTATEKILETDNMNDTLYPFARHYSAVWEFVVRDIATVTDMTGVTVQHKFPNDFKMKGLSELMTELQTAKTAAASTSTIAAIEDDINEILYSDRPNALKEIRIKNLINPFRGYTEADIRFIISQNNVPLYNRTLWENFESIFQDLEAEHQEPWLFDLAYDRIIELVKAKTQEYIKIIKEETPEPVESPFTQ